MATAIKHSTHDDPYANPYDAADDADRYAMWQMLIARDVESFVDADWSLCDPDFGRDEFEGISANGSFNPIDWTLRYPTVESYRDDWLKMAKEFQSVSLANVSPRELLYRMQKFAKVEISNGRAIVWKQFSADEALSTGGRHQISAQSVYRLRRIDGQWRIVGFVGYLPMEACTS